CLVYQCHGFASLSVGIHSFSANHLIYSSDDSWWAVLRNLHSFPTRRSSDLGRWSTAPRPRARCRLVSRGSRRGSRRGMPRDARRDRKSTRLNSSHVKISYAVFCLKKKTIDIHSISANQMLSSAADLWSKFIA